MEIRKAIFAKYRGKFAYFGIRFFSENVKQKSTGEIKVKL